MARVEPTVLDHLEWLGFVQPTGLVVSAHALVRAGAILDRRDVQGQALLREAVGLVDAVDEANTCITDFQEFAKKVLGWAWTPKYYAGSDGCPIPDELKVHLTDHGVKLQPTYAVREPAPEEGESPWQLLVTVVPLDTDLDAPISDNGYEASPHGRLERLLRHSGVVAGLLSNGRTLRLVSAPKGESSGWIDFQLRDMVAVPGRPICAAMRLLLNQNRLLTLPKDKRLSALLRESRRFQNQVSEALSEQVLHALYELLRGLQAADSHRNGELLRAVLGKDPNIVYRALLTVLLRLVFLLYAEERGMLPQDEAFLKYYSLSGLYERLREDAALYPDTMNQRYGAWAQLLVLFRMVYDGADTANLDMPPRHGELFDPDRFPFLEGRPDTSLSEFAEVPLVPDGTVHQVLESLLVLNGERLAYRTLDVEHIGSVYETLMGFQLETTTGRSIAIRAQKRTGAPTVIDLDELLTVATNERKKWLEERVGRKLTPRVLDAVKPARSVEELHIAFESVIDHRATPDIVPPGSLVLQPSDERRRSGSHYTPRELTEPIVQKALEPILKRLSEGKPKGPTPEDILDLKVCDPAMGSGAFLVEVCRQLGDVLLQAWAAHDQTPPVSEGVDLVVHARRLVAQRCLYGVDRNPVAVDLAKVSLWLVTLARDQPFTFLDHALRHGDSLVGLSLKQLLGFHWDETQNNLAGLRVEEDIRRAAELRDCIRTASDVTPEEQLKRWWDEANQALAKVRHYGDLVILAYFCAKTPLSRKLKREELAASILSIEVPSQDQDIGLSTDSPTTFHWEIEFPEVFGRPGRGFDCLIGNPPFLGGSRISSTLGPSYLDWLLEVHPASHGNGDLVAHFFRRAFELLRDCGTLGLIATNTLGQGDTRTTGLERIRREGGFIYHAQRRVRWPGSAAVVVSIVHIIRGDSLGAAILDGQEVPYISAFLFPAGKDTPPKKLPSNQNRSFLGVKTYGQGFVFDDEDSSGRANPMSLLADLAAIDRGVWRVVFPYLGGEEVNGSPRLETRRFVINFGDRTEEECWTHWPDLMALVADRVRPERLRNNRESYRRYWWQHGEKRVELWRAIDGLELVLALSRVSQHLALAKIPAHVVPSESLVVFPFERNSAFAALQSRVHEVWARFFGSSLEDRLRYTPSDCFETFPFPENWESRDDFEAVGKEYYEYRAQLMVENNEGLTKTYNRFHDPNESDPRIVRLRELHAAMDRAVLDAYGWHDIPTDCDFLLDYEIDEDEWGNRRKPYRYRWPDEVRDEVLGRLLELNAQRAAEEAERVLDSKSGRGRRARSRSTQEELF